MIHLDTNILIELTQPDSESYRYVYRMIREEVPISCSCIAWTEYMVGPCQQNQIALTLRLLGNSILPFQQNEAELAAQLFNAAGRKRGIKLDCMIAAAAISHQASLATQNHKDFEKFIPLGLSLADISANTD